MKTTLADIAKATGYSISTVSRALNGSGKISSKARVEIFQTAKELNYPVHVKPNGDRVLNELKVLFIITGFHQGEFYTSFFHGVDQAVEKQNIQLSLISIQKPFDEFLVRLKELTSKKYDGLILYTPAFRQAEYEEIKKILPDNLPVISNHLVETPIFNTVTFDSYGGGYLAAQHFLDQGYDSCGVIEGPIERTGSRNRANGFKDFIRKHAGMELAWRYSGKLSFDSGVAAFREFHSLKDKPRAVFTCNDVMAHAFLQEALLKGYRVPEDVAIVGYDDLPICMRHRPTISSIHTSYEKLGIVTIDKMKEMISNPGRVRGITSFLPVSLVARESSQINS